MATIFEAAGVRLPFELPPLSHAEFVEFCRWNPDLRAELTAEGELVLMAPAEAWGDSRNVAITSEIYLWNREQGESGIVFGQSAGFTLPNGAVRSPDASWMQQSRWDALTDQQRESFAHVCPDFVVERMSPSDTLQRRARRWTSIWQTARVWAGGLIENAAVLKFIAQTSRFSIWKTLRPSAPNRNCPVSSLT